jgi:hypothetical protein
LLDGQIGPTPSIVKKVYSVCYVRATGTEETEGSRAVSWDTRPGILPQSCGSAGSWCWFRPSNTTNDVVRRTSTGGRLWRRKGPRSTLYQSFVASNIMPDVRRLRPSGVISIALSPEKQDQQNVRKLKGLKRPRLAGTGGRDLRRQERHRRGPDAHRRKGSGVRGRPVTADVPSDGAPWCVGWEIVDAAADPEAVRPAVLACAAVGPVVGLTSEALTVTVAIRLAKWPT